MSKIFPKITNNTEKHESYKRQMERFNLAKDSGFYFECLFILYAVIEDRLLAFLYYGGVVSNNREKITKNKKVKPYLEIILDPLKKRKYCIDQISIKISIIRHIIQFSQQYDPEVYQQNYQDVICSQLNKAKGKEEILLILDSIEKWCLARNELVHALLRKNVENQEEKLVNLIEDGFMYYRTFDNFVRRFKTGNNIRKQFNIQ